MLKPEVRAELTKLRKEMDQANPDDPKSKDRIDSLSRRVDSLLQEQSDPQSGDPYGVLREQLRDSATYFEVSHPKLTDVINHVIYKLNTLGI